MKTALSTRNLEIKLAICARFAEAIQLLGYSGKEISIKLGYETPSTVYSVISQKCLPDTIKLALLANIKSPSGHRINLNWLITGDGEALIKPDKRVSTKTDRLLSSLSGKKIKALEVLLS